MKADDNRALVLIERAERILNDWLVDNTDQVFEEQPEIDDARSLLNEAIDLVREGKA